MLKDLLKLLSQLEEGPMMEQALMAIKNIVEGDPNHPNLAEMEMAKGHDGFIRAVKTFRNRTGHGLKESCEKFEALGFKRP